MARDRERRQDDFDRLRLQMEGRTAAQEQFRKVDDVNSMLLDAIKAKLAILEHQTGSVST